MRGFVHSILKHRWHRSIRIVPALLLLTIPSAATSQVALNEVHFHPAHPETSPFREPVEEEFLEFLNLTDNPIDISGWRLNDGVDFTFPPNTTIPANGLIVVAADPNTFLDSYPNFDTQISTLFGPWSGRLSNSGERIRLVNAFGDSVDEVRYADDGDWSFRVRGPVDFGHEGWIWDDGPDGGGYSLELAQPLLSNDLGQNWRKSTSVGGSPGAPNSAIQENVAPILFNLTHSPALPTSSDSITIQLQVLDESASLENLDVQLFYRTADDQEFIAIPMSASDVSPDFLGVAFLFVFEARLDPQPDGSVVEFYFTAQDQAGLTRFWPEVAGLADPTAFSANFLFQVTDANAAPPEDAAPVFRIIMTERERAELAALGRDRLESNSNARMNATFISQDADGVHVRYRVGVRNRGHGSRNQQPNNYRVHFRNDDPWHGITDLNINGQAPILQFLGSAFTRALDLPSAKSQLVRTYINGANLSPTGSPRFGYYVANEVLDSDYLDRRFNSDENGNLYRARRIQLPGADLSYRGDDPDAYRKNYFKQTNTSVDDWTDLIELSRALDASSEEEYASAVRDWVDVDNWLRYFAVDAFFDNTETNLGSGNADDYAMYSGVLDPRFRLIPYDLDSIWGFGSDREISGYNLFRAGRVPTIERFLKHPEFAPEYFRVVRDIYSNWLKEAQIRDFVHNTLRDYAPVEFRNHLIDFAKRRADFLIGSVPDQLSYLILNSSSRWSPDGIWTVTDPSLQLWGQADAIDARRVEVQGEVADWIAWQGSWSDFSVPLDYGDNVIHVAAFDESGAVIEEQRIPVRRLPDFAETTVGTRIEFGSISEDQTWEKSGSPYWINQDLTIIPDATLTVGPGVTVYLAPETEIHVQGGLIIEGNPTERIQLRLKPQSPDGARWNGIQWTDSTEISRLTYVDFSHSDGTNISCEIIRSEVIMENVHWLNTTRKAVELRDASARFSYCEFPNVVNDETVHGQGLPEDGYLIFNNNVFGHASGYSDVIDFTGGKRPGPILQIWNNTFLGGADDGLDLDGTDAHIEGNYFQNFIKHNSSSSSANAIATDLGSVIVAANNTFYNNDHDVLLKNGAELISHNNTFTGTLQAVVAMDEPNRNVDPGKTVVMIGNRFHQQSPIFFGAPTEELENGSARIELNHNIFDFPVSPDSIPSQAYLGEQNRFGKPTTTTTLLSPQESDTQPSQDIGPGGIPAGAQKSRKLTLHPNPHREWIPATNPTFEVYGPGITEYSYRWNDSEWSSLTKVDEPIRLTHLPQGAQKLDIRGWDSAGAYSHFDPIEKTFIWESPTLSEPPLLITEILAMQDRAAPLGSEGEGLIYPDWIELYNPNSTPVDLTGYGLTDRAADPFRFQFPDGKIILPFEHLTVPSELPLGKEGIDLGFGISRQGETIILNRLSPSGAETIDQVTFGRQINNHSMSRNANGQWSLTLPNLGGPSHGSMIPIASVDHLRINEILPLPDPNSEIRNPFLEIINLAPFPVHLGSARIGLADRGFLHSHVFPPLSFIQAGETFSAEVTGDGNSSVDANELNFKFPNHVGHLTLWDEYGKTVDRIQYTAPRIGASYERGARPEDQETFQWNWTPSPGFESLADLPAFINIQLQPVTHGSPWEVWIESTHPTANWTFPALNSNQSSLWNVMDSPFWSAENSLLPDYPGSELSLRTSPIYLRKPIRIHPAISSPHPDLPQPTALHLTLTRLDQRGWMKVWWNGIPLNSVRSELDTQTYSLTLPEPSEWAEHNWLAIEFHPDNSQNFMLAPNFTLEFSAYPESPADLATRDTDQDGIHDLWEIEYNSDPDNPEDADLDWDRDGLTSFEEFLAGSHPGRPDDNLHLKISHTSWLGEDLTIEIPDTFFGQIYHLESSEELAQDFHDIYQTLFRKFGNGGSLKWTINNSSNTEHRAKSLYFRLYTEKTPVLRMMEP